MSQISKNFTREEATCRCGCGKVVLVDSVIELIQNIRNEYGSSILINRWYSCPEHNKEVGGASSSFHILGLAVDLRPGDGDLKELYLVCEKAEPNGLGIYPEKKFIHIDLGTRIQRWIYRKGTYWYAF